MTDYTDAPLIAHDAWMGGDNDCLFTDHGMWIAETHHTTDVDGVDINLPAQANAERLAACWNACRDLADPGVVPELVAALESIAHNDKTPHYDYSGPYAKNRLGQVPEGSGQRWMTPREIARDLLKRVRGQG